tara:strand:+ start:194 stop:1177 length:984 start_codon:yes stop_codon:yes gene_type:complete
MRHGYVALFCLAAAAVRVSALRVADDAEERQRLLDRPGAKAVALTASGGLAAAAAKTVTAPLERVKLLAQAGETGNMGQLLTAVVAREGWAGLWRGNKANVLRVIPNKGILMMCADMYKSTVRRLLPGSTRTVVSSVAGALAGLTTVLMTYPLELVRTRMAFRICDAATDASAVSAAHATVYSTLAGIVARDGLLGLYAGVGATLVGGPVFEGIKFGVHDFIKQRMPSDADGRHAPVWSMLSGAIAGTLAHALTYPLDTVRRRMQVSGAPGSSYCYGSITECIRVMVATEGVNSLFVGISATLIRSVPNLGIQFLLYELLKRSLGFS